MMTDRGTGQTTYELLLKMTNDKIKELRQKSLTEGRAIPEDAPIQTQLAGMWWSMEIQLLGTLWAVAEMIDMVQMDR